MSKYPKPKKDATLGALEIYLKPDKVWWDDSPCCGGKWFLDLRYPKSIALKEHFRLTYRPEKGRIDVIEWITDFPSKRIGSIVCNSIEELKWMLHFTGIKAMKISSKSRAEMNEKYLK